MPKRPHVIIFNPDQMRADALHHLGNPASVTPNLDRLACEDGVSFRSAFCQNPICTPSRCSFFSGLYPHVFGHRTISYMQLPEEPNILRRMKEAGWYVWMNARNDFLPAQKEGVFAEYCDELYLEDDMRPLPPPKNPNWRGEPGGSSYYSFYVGELCTDKNGEYYDSDASAVHGLVERIKNLPEDKPLCAFLGLMYPHPPYQAEEPWFSMIDREKLPPRVVLPDGCPGKPAMVRELRRLYNMDSWTEDRWNELRATYLGMCARVDYQFGQVVAALKEAGIYDDTLIIFLADHGDFTGDYGLVEKTQNTFEDCLTNVPFLIKPPQSCGVKPGIREGMAELVDMCATICDYTGVEPGHTHFGRSLRPAVEGEDAPREYVFCEGGHRADETHCNSAGKNPNPAALYYPRFMAQSSPGAVCGKGTMIRTKDFKYVRRYDEQDEFYDLRADPREQHNAVDDPAYREIMLDLREKMLDWYQQTCDIVPFQPDERFNDQMKLAKLTGSMDHEKWLKVKVRVEEGIPLAEAVK